MSLSFSGSSWNRVGRTGVSGREHARAHERERTRTRRSVVEQIKEGTTFHDGPSGY